ncbi:MAG: imidazole glycerol phosphate synthase subunit HisH [Acidimicrobiia bacterium]|nr:imidazole glycerol phosphate synthase subunit HisH [Acidimicrobiia bacterium]
MTTTWPRPPSRGWRWPSARRSPSTNGASGWPPLRACSHESTRPPRSHHRCPVRIAVVDHGAGNLVSISRGLETVGAEVILATTPEQIDRADGVVLPGVGATGAVMAGIRSAGLEDVLRTYNRPLLGICVGMQVLFEGSDEDDADCLGLISGGNHRLRNAPRLPHIGWNDVTATASDPLLAGLDDTTLFYFVHSFAPRPSDPTTVIATTEYGEEFASVVRQGDVWGTQFHPERSHVAGRSILSNFVAAVGATRVA